MSQPHIKCPSSGLYGTPPSVNFFTPEFEDDSLDLDGDLREPGDPTLSRCYLYDTENN
jgi:hypothetical protein